MKDIETIKTELLSLLKSRYPYLDFSEGEILHDLIVYAPSFEFAALYQLLEEVKNQQSVETADAAGLEKIGSNFGVFRRAPSRASGEVTFYTKTLTSDIVIPPGTVVSTLGGKSVQFSVVQGGTMYAAISSSYYNPTTERYEITLPIICDVLGKDGVVGEGTITRIVTPVFGLDGVINLRPTTGGREEETDDQFRNRILLKFAGIGIGTISGIMSLIMEFPDVKDVYVNKTPIRSDLGAVDVFIKGEIPRPYTEIKEFVSLQPPEVITLAKQPVLSIQSVRGVVSGLVQNPSLVLDTREYGGSVKGFDGVKGHSRPAQGDTFVIQYTYNGLIEDIQGILERDEYQVIGTDILIKQAFKITVDLTIQIKALPGFSSLDVQQRVSDALAKFFDDYKIGEEVQTADIVYQIMNVDGVDDVLIPFSQFVARKPTGETILPNTSGNIAVPHNAYAALGTLTLLVVV